MSPTKDPTVSVCIASHNQGHLLGEAIASVLKQDYKDIEVIVLDDGSTDDTKTKVGLMAFPNVHYHRSEKPSGSGGAFNKAIAHATGEFIVLLCADDVFTDNRVISDIVAVFLKHPQVAHVSRWYHQFIDGDRRPVRAWRTPDIVELANNPSGLAFRKEALKDPQRPNQYHELSNDMFIEAPSLVYKIMIDPRNYAMIMPWDTVAVRIHQSTARSHSYYKKMWKTSPVEAWSKVGGTSIQRDFTSLIQIRNYFTWWATAKECLNFIKLRPFNILEPGFLFFAALSLLLPRFILIHLPHLYRITIGRWTTKEIKRP